MKKHLRLFLLLLVITPALVSAQDIDVDTTAFKPVNATILLKDGTQLRGLLLSESLAGVTIKTDNLGEIIVTRDKIDRIDKMTDGYYRNGNYWFANPNSTRYFFAPSAYPLRKGEGYYQNAYLFVNAVSVGVTDHFTMGGGFVLNPAFRNWGVGFLTPKYSFPSRSNVTFGVGAIVIGAYVRGFGLFTSNREVSSFLGGIGYGTVTFGNKEKNGSVGVGWAFGNGEISSKPVVTLSYMSRVARRVGLVTENWIIIPSQGSGGALLSGGVRFFGEKMSVDLALLSPVYKGQRGFTAGPYVDFVVKFGPKEKKRAPDEN